MSESGPSHLYICVFLFFLVFGAPERPSNRMFNTSRQGGHTHTQQRSIFFFYLVVLPVALIDRCFEMSAVSDVGSTGKIPALQLPTVDDAARLKKCLPLSAVVVVSHGTASERCAPMKRPINKPLAMLLLRPSTLTISNSNARASNRKIFGPPDPRTLQPTDRLIVVYHRIMNISLKNAFSPFVFIPLEQLSYLSRIPVGYCGTGPGFWLLI